MKAPSPADFEPDGEALSQCLAEAQALLDAIDQGELLSDAPASPSARRRYRTGATLLELVRRQLSEAQTLLARQPEAVPAKKPAATEPRSVRPAGQRASGDSRRGALN